MVKLFLPITVDYVLVQPAKLYLYNSTNFLLLNYPAYKLTYNKHLRILSFSCPNKLPQTFSKTFLSSFIFTWENFFFTKLLFLGKGFKLRKIRNTTYFYFNHSHLQVFCNNTLKLKKIQKTKLLLFHKDLNQLHACRSTLTKIKRVNTYTKRGLRASKQLVYLRKNKTGAA